VLRRAPRLRPPKVVLAEALNPQVARSSRRTRRVSASRSSRSRTRRRDRSRGVGRGSEDAAAVFFQQPNFLGCLEDAPALAAARTTPVRSRSRTSISCRSACSRRRGRTAARSRSGRASRRELAVVRRPALRLPRGAAWTTSGACPVASSARRSTRTDVARSSSRSRPASSTFAGEGDLEHHDEPDLARARRARDALVAGPEGLREVGRPASRSRSTCATRAARAGVRRTERSRRWHSARRFPRARSFAARERGVQPGYALGRDYEGMDDVLLVA
jgi:hypothetical protein